MVVNCPFEATSSHRHPNILTIKGGGRREVSFQYMNLEDQGEKEKDEKIPFYIFHDIIVSGKNKGHLHACLYMIMDKFLGPSFWVVIHFGG